MLKPFLRENESLLPLPSLLDERINMMLAPEELIDSDVPIGSGAEGNEAVFVRKFQSEIAKVMVGKLASTNIQWASNPKGSAKRSTLSVIDLGAFPGDKECLVLKIGKPGVDRTYLVELQGAEIYLEEELKEASEANKAINENDNPFSTIGREYWIDNTDTEPTEGEEKNLDTVPSAKYIFNRFFYSKIAQTTVLHVGCHVNPKEFSIAPAMEEDEAFDVRDFFVPLSGVKPTEDGQALEMIDGSKISDEVREQILALARFKISDDGKQILPKPDFA